MTKREYKQFCPVARTLDVIGERWTMLIVRDLLRGPLRYTDLRNGLPGMASNLLAQRLGEMETAGLIRREHHDRPAPRDVYVITDRGRDLRPVVLALARFGLPYLDAPSDEQPLGPFMIPDALAALVLTEELPERELTIGFDLDEGRYLMTVAPAGKPGNRLPVTDRIAARESTDSDNPDVRVIGSLGVLLWIRRGDLDPAEAQSQALISLEGEADDVTAVRQMFGFERKLRAPVAQD